MPLRGARDTSMESGSLSWPFIYACRPGEFQPLGPVEPGHERADARAYVLDRMRRGRGAPGDQRRGAGSHLAVELAREPAVADLGEDGLHRLAACRADDARAACRVPECRGARDRA